MSAAQAVRILTANSGIQFDPSIVGALTVLVEEREGGERIGSPEAQAVGA